MPDYDMPPQPSTDDLGEEHRLATIKVLTQVAKTTGREDSLPDVLEMLGLVTFKERESKQ